MLQKYPPHNIERYLEKLDIDEIRSICQPLEYHFGLTSFVFRKSYGIFIIINSDGKLSTLHPIYRTQSSPKVSVSPSDNPPYDDPGSIVSKAVIFSVNDQFTFWVTVYGQVGLFNSTTMKPMLGIGSRLELHAYGIGYDNCAVYAYPDGEFIKVAIAGLR